MGVGDDVSLAVAVRVRCRDEEARAVGCGAFSDCHYLRGGEDGFGARDRRRGSVERLDDVLFYLFEHVVRYFLAVKIFLYRGEILVAYGVCQSVGVVLRNLAFHTCQHDDVRDYRDAHNHRDDHEQNRDRRHFFVGSAARAVGRMVDGGAFGAAVARFVEEVVEIVHSLLRTFYMLILF